VPSGFNAVLTSRMFPQSDKTAMFQLERLLDTSAHLPGTRNAAEAVSCIAPPLLDRCERF
jgi:hypothetical protein